MRHVNRSTTGQDLPVEEYTMPDWVGIDPSAQWWVDGRLVQLAVVDSEA